MTTITGALHVNTLAAEVRLGAHRRFLEEMSEETEGRDGQKVSTVRLSNLAQAPALIRWGWCHHRCLPEASDYIIDADRIDTLSKALSWTLHLMDKRWLPGTD